ncbi:hypothetical protein [Allosphingosinicella sp.]|jgi:hypothetical protein|uniref:hypothetical protein n=1 Tax=Allosphingosinicella sp. TaxID=2823234 RepID=UPI002F22719A
MDVASSASKGPLLVRYRGDERRVEVDVPGLGEPLFWESETLPFAALGSDFAALAALPAAMATARDLHVEGRLDSELARNLANISSFWAQWRPGVYSAIRISADELVEARPARCGEGWALCLSGGVDSTFALLDNAARPPGLGYPIPTGLFVHGFDYPLDRIDAVETLLASIRGPARFAGAKIAVVRTNWKTALCRQGPADWGHMFPLGLAAILHLFAGGHRGGLIASDCTFREDHEIAPVGNNPATNRMLSSAAFPIQPLGERTSRMDKIAGIARLGFLADVNVCWQGPRTGRNCSECDKCLRTMFLCEAAAIDPSPAFGRRLSAARLARMRIVSPSDYLFIKKAVSDYSPEADPKLRRAARIPLARFELRRAARVAKRLALGRPLR